MKHTNRTQTRFLMKAVLVVATFSGILASAATQFFPDPEDPWLTFRRGMGSDTEASQYYESIKAPPDFDAWKATYFPASAERTEAKYYNSGDLGFGRDMNCRDNRTQYIACFVVNHGFGPGGPVQPAVNNAISEGRFKLPAVAMVYDRTMEGKPNDVTFYIYNNKGPPLIQVPLDSEVEVRKFVPQLCLACHGGEYEAREPPEVPAESANTVSGANFLPFDLTAFEYSKRPDFTQAAQESDFKALNLLVRETNPDDPIKELIAGWYDRDVAPAPNLQPDEQNVGYVLRGYDNNADDRKLYHNVYKPYCQTCHVAQSNRPLINAADFDNPSIGLFARLRVFNTYEMPTAERTAHNFWTSVTTAPTSNNEPAVNAPAFLADNRGWSIQVTRLDNRSPMSGGCGTPATGSIPGTPSTDCTLREAIIAANNDPDRSIITFKESSACINGTCTYNVNQPGTAVDDNDAMNDAIAGDLDITEDLTILGNGAANTIIDGGAIDRVFDIFKPTVKMPGELFPGEVRGVVIQGVTIRNGKLTGSGLDQVGAGIRNGGTLTLNHSVVTDNNGAGNFGGGLYNVGTAEINGSTIGPNNTSGFGGGITNDGSLMLNNSTVSGNNAIVYGGGISSGFPGVGGSTKVIHSTVTGNTGVSGGGGIAAFGNSIITTRNSIIAGNTSDTAPADCLNQGNARLISGGYNLVGQNGDSNGCPVVPDRDIVLAGDISTAIDTTREGILPFHALVFDSRAIDAIPLELDLTKPDPPCRPPTYDQLNESRPLEGDGKGDVPACDIGAVELTEPLSSPPADLAITKTDSPDPATPGDNLTYRVSIINNGPGEASSVNLTDTLPAGVTFVSTTPSAGSCSGTSTVTCDLESLASGANATVEIVITPTAAGTITNTAAVRANEPDPDQTNNTDTEDTKVNPIPVTVTCGGLPRTMGCTVNGAVQECVGTPDPDVITGTPGMDVIHGLDGQDIIRGLRGRDTICGGRGSDRLFGQRGADTLFGQRGNDTLNGGPGTDKCAGGRGSDTILNCE